MSGAQPDVDMGGATPQIAAADSHLPPLHITLANGGQDLQMHLQSTDGPDQVQHFVARAVGAEAFQIRLTCASQAASSIDIQARRAFSAELMDA